MTRATRPDTISALEREGDTALSVDPAHAAECFDRAIALGGDAASSAARRAQAAFAVGDLATVDRILETVFDAASHQEAVPDLERAVDVAAASWAQRGMLDRAAELYRWAGHDRLGASAGLGAVAMAGVGDRVGADAMADAAAATASPSTFSALTRLLAHGIRASIDDDEHHTALSIFIRAADLHNSSPSSPPLPETPAALAAIVALHTGELDIAASVVASALDHGHSRPAERSRLLLLRGWTAMLADRPALARASLAEAGDHLVARDALWHAALEAGIARRVDDTAALAVAWHRAREVILHVPITLFSLLPLCELVVDAARARESRWLDQHVDGALDVLRSLGSPTLWSLPLHWACTQAAILTDQPRSMEPHSKAILRAARRDHRAAALAEAGRQWIAVLAGTVDERAVVSAAHRLAAIGLTWDGSRLAGHAAAHAPDRKVMSELLACARALHPGDSIDPALASTAITDGHGLSAREVEVAKLVMAGKTYREIGESIFISPRTAEHHIAEVRRRLGASSRSELRERLRDVLGEQPA